MWIKKQKNKWGNSENENVIIRWSFDSSPSYLLYKSNSEIEFGDYKTFSTLTEAKNETI